ncbi:DNA N-6-adenine-methyltransferase [Curtobacterium sp. MCBD17_008]|uniref:DNA N-6-adenine-methyltransferase n=1 Tax=Curtobacterium sp. MCBD17_008 TaxID=2175656 RepID=UPI0015E87775|nr:DNA N-6-adenine-methyltransferase [Curtobacterium sp. MCBD17_008]
MTNATTHTIKAHSAQTSNGETAPSRRGRGFTHESGPHNPNIEWYTPAAVFNALGVEFDLDPCSPGSALSNVPAVSCFTIDDDGLTSPWHGMCWVNPPYDDTDTWLEKPAAHGDGIALVFARTDTKWAHKAMASADVVCFTAGRIKFINGRTGRPQGSPGAGSMFLAWGERAARALRQADLGLCFSVLS